MSRTKHFSSAKVARYIASRDYGREQETIEQAATEMTGKPDALAASALTELVRRLNQAIKALADDGDYVTTGERDDSIPDADDLVFPGLKIGDKLYSGDLSYGFQTTIVVYVADSGHVRVVGELTNLNYLRNGYYLFTSWAGNSARKTLVAAVEAAAVSEIAYHRPRLEWAEKALAAARAGADLSEFVQGKDDFEDEDA